MCQVFGHHADTHFNAYLIEVNVVGSGHGILEINPAISRPVPVTKTPAALSQLKISGVPDSPLPIGHATVQGGNRHHRLDRGAWRILTTQRPVEQGLVDIGTEIAVVLNTDTGDKLVGIKAWHAGQRQDTSSLRFDSHNSATTPLEQLVGLALQAQVKVQLKILTGHRVYPL